MGSDGVDLLPDDIQSPNVELILPLASKSIFERVVFEAYADDDVGVESVEFMVDGNVLENGALSLTEPPWQVGWDCSQLVNGFHYFQARAWDATGRDGLSAVVVVRKTDPPQDFTIDTLQSYVEVKEGDEIGWTLPDFMGEYTSYGTRFIPHSSCQITRFGIKLYVSKYWLGTCPLSFEIRSSHNNKPDSLIYADTVSVNDHLRIPAPGGEVTDWLTFNLYRHNLQTVSDFFIILNLANDQPGDTVALLTDNGQWRNYHGVVQKDGEWQDFTAGSRFAFNPLIFAVVKYQ